MSKLSDKHSASNALPVFNTRMAFIIPIGLVRWSVLKDIQSPFKPKVHFVKNLNVTARYLRLDEKTVPNLHKDLKFISKPSGREKTGLSRTAKQSFYLLKYSFKEIDRPEYALIMLAEHEFDADSYCKCHFSPHDIIYLKNAVLSSGSNACNDIKNIIKKITVKGFACCIDPIVKATVIDIRVAMNDNNSPSGSDYLKKDRNNRYCNSDAAPVGLSSFLKRNIPGYIRPDDTDCSDMERWVYGLLHGNDNFMMADDSVIKDEVRSYYSNNYIERYWASPSTVLTVKTDSPFLEPKDDDSCDKFCDFDSLLETCMMVTLNRKITKFLSSHHSMKFHEFEEKKAEIATYFNYTVMNLEELDRKLQFFIRRSNLQERNERVLSIVTPPTQCY